MYHTLLHLLIILNLAISLFILGGGILSPDYAKFNIYTFIPLIYILNIFPYDILTESQYYLASKYDNTKEPQEVIKENSQIYILPIIQNNVSNIYYETFNPLNYQGILVLGFIINIYILKYKWNDF